MRTAASLLLGAVLLCGPTVAGVSLDVTPDLQQFFTEDSVSLRCPEGGQTVRRTAGGQTGQCGPDFGTMRGSSCTVSRLSPSDSGLYWCEKRGERSQQVNITVFSPEEHPIILEIPALPVLTGSELRLRCRTQSGVTRAAYFFRDSVHTRDRVQNETLTLSPVQLSDEGLYWCSTNLLGSSPHSWLEVRAVTPTPPPPPSVSVSRLFCHLVVVCLLCTSTVLMVLSCIKKTGDKLAVSMEMSQRVDDITEHVF